MGRGRVKGVGTWVGGYRERGESEKGVKRDSE